MKSFNDKFKKVVDLVPLRAEEVVPDYFENSITAIAIPKSGALIDWLFEVAKPKTSAEIVNFWHGAIPTMEEALRGPDCNVQCIPQRVA